MNTKRIVSLIIATIMVLSLIPVMAISTSAATVEGDWTTYRAALNYPSKDDEVDPDGEETIYPPESGYEYTSEGFTVLQPSYKDITPYMTVSTKDKQSIKDGIYLQFRIDDYSYDGGTGADQWICLSLNTGKQEDDGTFSGKVAPGSAKFGGGWLTLIRGAGAGKFISFPHLTDPANGDFGGTFNNIGRVEGTAPMDDEGHEIYTMEITWDGSAYQIVVNGVVQPNSAQATALLEKLDSNGEFYVGITMSAAVKDGTAGLTILKYGTSESDATTPIGSDSKDPEPNELTIADIAPADSIEANMPAILWDPTTRNITGGNNCVFTALGDNTWRVSATDTNIYFGFTPKRSWSYDAVDFPVFGILLRNIWVDSGTLWYAAGEVMAPQNDMTLPFSIYDGEFYGNGEYVFIPLDLSDMWEGRIHNIRMDLTMADPEEREFDICFAGMFRSVEEANSYAKTYLDNLGINVTETEAPDTEESGVDTDVSDTNAVVSDSIADTDTSINVNNNGSDVTTPVENGCTSVVSFGAVAILSIAAVAVAFRKKD